MEPGLEGSTSPLSRRDRLLAVWSPVASGPCTRGGDLRSKQRLILLVPLDWTVVLLLDLLQGHLLLEEPLRIRHDVILSPRVNAGKEFVLLWCQPEFKILSHC